MDALDSAAAGMAAQARRLDIVSSNLARAPEAGYRPQRPVITQFERDLMAAGVAIDTQGALRRTGEPTDLALLGDGYFAVKSADGVRYTRDGRFVPDGNGKLCDAVGNAVLGNLGALAFPHGARIDGDGRVMLGGTAIDRVRVATLPHGTLDERGYAPPSATPRRSSAAVKAGYLEDSGVDVIGEMTSLVAAQRAYEANQKSAQRADESLRRAVTDVGTVHP